MDDATQRHIWRIAHRHRGTEGCVLVAVGKAHLDGNAVAIGEGAGSLYTLA